MIKSLVKAPKKTISKEFLSFLPKMRIFMKKFSPVSFWTFRPLRDISEKYWQQFLRKNDHWPTDLLSYWPTNKLTVSFVGTFQLEVRRIFKKQIIERIQNLALKETNWSVFESTPREQQKTKSVNKYYTKDKIIW